MPYLISQIVAIVLVAIGGLALLASIVGLAWFLITDVVLERWLWRYSPPDFLIDPPWHVYGFCIAIGGCAIGAVGQGLFGP